MHSQRHKMNALKLRKKAAPRGEQRLHSQVAVCALNSS
jgi:hypothetical protein